MPLDETKPRMGCRSQTVATPTYVGGECASPLSQAHAPVLACPICGREFTSKIGVGVHLKSAHKKVANDMIVTERKKTIWSQEEIRLVASLLAEAIAGGTCGGINQLLARLHPTLTLDSIKSRRRDLNYKSLVSEFLEEFKSLKAQSEEPVVESATNAYH